MHIVLDYNEDLSAVYEATVDVDQWYTLGLFLNVKPSELNKVNRDYHFSDEALQRMLGIWLRSGQATWSSLISALFKMGERKLAIRIAKKRGGHSVADIDLLVKYARGDGIFFLKVFLCVTLQLTISSHTR